MTVLVTGAGLVGSLTASELVKRSHRVVLVDLRPVPEWIQTLVPLDRIQIESLDIRDKPGVLALMQGYGVTHVVHTAAALSHAIRQDPALASEVNLGGTVNVLEACRQCRVRQLVFASSTTVYYPIFHRPHTQPISEDFSFHAVSERPGSLYAASKLAAEFFIQHFATQYGLNVAILRYSAVLGLWAGPNHSVPGRLLQELLGHHSSSKRVHLSDPLLMWQGGEDFIDARDVALANVAAVEAQELPSRVYAIASGRMASFSDFIQAARAQSPDLTITHEEPGPHGFAGFAHPRDVPFDVSRAQLELGFFCRHDLGDSLAWSARSRSGH